MDTSNALRRGGRIFHTGLCICFLSLLCSWPAMASATTQEPVYTISQEQMDQLQSNLNRLQSINSKLLSDSKKQSQQIADLQTRLAKAEQQSRDLETQLIQAETDSQKASDSLTKANQSLKEYAREEKRTRLRIKAQRNTWEAVAAGLLLAWAAK